LSGSFHVLEKKKVVGKGDRLLRKGKISSWEEILEIICKRVIVAWKDR